MADANRPLTRICQVASHFLAHRGRRPEPHRAAEPVLGIWRDPSPLATVSTLSQPPSSSGGASVPLVRDSFGHEGEWYVCWLATDLGPQGEIETLGGLLNLLVEEGVGQGPEPGGSFSPCFAHTDSEQANRALVERLGTRFPGLLGRTVTQDPDTGRLLPQPDLQTIATG